MSVIYRYPLEITDRQTVQVPAGSWFLSAAAYKGMFGNEPTEISTWWHVVNPDAQLEPVKIRIIGTGNPFHDKLEDLIPLATVIVNHSAASTVWHIFEDYNDGLKLPQESGK